MTLATTVTLRYLGGNPAYVLGGHIPARIDDVWGSLYHKASKAWITPAFRPVHQKTLNDLRKVSTHLELDDSVRKHLADTEEFEEIPADFRFITTPFQHQLEGLRWAYNLPRAGLFFDPGLGKCKITVDLQRLTDSKLLILCPSVVLRTWREEFMTHGEVDDVIVVEGSRKAKEAAIAQARERAPAALVITYESAMTHIQELYRVGYDLFVMDESHRAKEITSARTRAALTLSEGRPRRVLLSGTPTLGNPFSLYTQFRALGHYFAPESYPKYREKYASFSKFNAHQVIGYRNMEHLNTRVNEVCLRRTQDECLDLPELRIIDVPFDLSNEQKDAYNLLITDSGDPLGAAEGFLASRGLLTIDNGPARPVPYAWAPETVSRLNKLEQVVGGFLNKSDANLGICNGCSSLERCIEDNVRAYTPACRVAPKKATVPYRFKHNARKEAAKELLESILENPDNKSIVWTRYIIELEDVAALAKELKVEYVVVKGGMSVQAFENAKSAFNTNPRCRLYIGQVASGIGVTLNAANYTLYYSLPWSHEHYNQSLRRNYRIGQKRKVTVYRLLARNSTDYHKAAALDQKVEVEDMLTSSDYTPACPVHSAGARGRGACRCDGSIDRIVAALEVIQ